jgi:hypothetical protein
MLLRRIYDYSVTFILRYDPHLLHSKIKFPVSLKYVGIRLRYGGVGRLIVYRPGRDGAALGRFFCFERIFGEFIPQLELNKKCYNSSFAILR